MKRIKYYLLFLVGLISCNLISTPLEIQTVTTNDLGKDTVISNVTDEYFSIELYSYGNGSSWGAKSYVKENVSGGKYRAKVIMIPDEDGNVKKFDDPTLFLNYMFERNYEMIEQKKERRIFHYTFKRK